MAEPYKQDQVNAGTVNLAGQNWMGFPKRKEVAVEVIKSLPSQLIGFQEFGIHSRVALERGGVKLAYVAGKQLGHIILNTIGYDPDRFTPVEFDTFWLSDDKTCKKGWDGQIRAATWAIFDDNETDQQFLHINVHPDNAGTEAKIEGIKLVLEFPQNNSGLPTIITADSNISVDSPNPMWRDKERRKPYDLMIKAGFLDTWKESHPTQPRPMTYHGFQGQDYEIDEWGTYDTEWIFTRGFKVNNCVVVRDSKGGVFPSDHYPMTAQLKFENK